MLTGAPLINSPIEMHAFLQVIRPDLMPEFFKFANRYCEPVKKSDGVHYNGASFTDELLFLYQKRFAIRRLRDDEEVIKLLPKV